MPSGRAARFWWPDTCASPSSGMRVVMVRRPVGPLRPKRGAQIVDPAPMAAGTYGETPPERDGVIRPIEGLVEKPPIARRPAARPQLAHDGVSDGRRIRPLEIQLLHHRRALAERAPPGAEIFGQHGAVPGADVRTVRAHGGVWLWLGGERALIGPSFEPSEQGSLPLRGHVGAGVRA